MEDKIENGYDEFLRNISLQIYKSTFGWRRFFIKDYWRLKMKKKCYRHSNYSAAASYLKIYREYQEAEQIYFKVTGWPRSSDHLIDPDKEKEAEDISIKMGFKNQENANE